MRKGPRTGACEAHQSRTARREQGPRQGRSWPDWLRSGSMRESGRSPGLAGRPGSRQPYPPASGRPGGRWSSAYTPSTQVPGWSSGKTNSNSGPLGIPGHAARRRISPAAQAFPRTGRAGARRRRGWPREGGRARLHPTPFLSQNFRRTRVAAWAGGYGRPKGIPRPIVAGKGIPASCNAGSVTRGWAAGRTTGGAATCVSRAFCRERVRAGRRHWR